MLNREELIYDIYNKAGELLPDFGIDLVQIALYSEVRIPQFFNKPT